MLFAGGRSFFVKIINFFSYLFAYITKTLYICSVNQIEAYELARDEEKGGR